MPPPPTEPDSQTAANAIRIRAKLGEWYPFASHWLPTPNGDLHYLDDGPTAEQAANSDQSPDTLLFVHGNPTWSFHWRRLISRYSPNHRCVAVDHMGCGLSQLQAKPHLLADHIDNLHALVESLDLQNVTLVAQDWGGAIGLGALLRERTRFSRIVLFNTGAFPPWYIPWRIRVCRWPILGDVLLRGANAFSRAALKMTLSQTKLPPEVAAGYLAPYHNWRHRAAVNQFVRDIPLSPSHPTWQTLAEIEAGLPSLAELPKLLVWGEEDWCFTTECLDRFEQHWPSSASHHHSHRLANVGHWVVEDVPARVEQLMDEFLSQSPLESGTTPAHFDDRATTKSTRIV